VKLALLLALVACSGASSSPTTPTTPPASLPPGVLWQTTSEPWHLPRAASAEAVFGDLALFGGANGWMTLVDLKIGLPIRARKLDMGTITDVAHLGNNKWVIVGLSGTELESATVAYAIDGDTLDPTEIKLGTRGKHSFALPHVAVVSEGGVVISGRGLPLHIYDPVTWGVRATLDNQIGWGRLTARGEILLAERLGTVKRWNITTNGQRDLPRGTVTHVAVADGIDIIRVARFGQWIAELHPDGGAAVQLKEQIDALAVDSTGKQLITAARNELRIHSLPDGKIIKSIPVDKQIGLGAFRVFGKQVHVTGNGVLRVIDLETGAIKPAGPQSIQASSLAVGIDGGLLAANDDVWTVSGGKVTATERVGGDGAALEIMRIDDPRHYVTSKTDARNAILSLHTFGDKTPKTWSLEESSVTATWITRDARLMFDAETRGEHKVMRTKDATVETLFAYNSDSEVLAADPEAELLISLDGRVAVVGLDGKTRSTIRVPHCESTLDFGVLEPGGTRAILYDTKDLSLWDRRTGKLIANIKAKSPEDVVFIPNRQEIVIAFEDKVVLWTPTKGARALRFPDVIEPAVSADGRKLALAYFDGRLGLYDLDGLIASTALGPDLPAGDPIPASCGEADPVALPPDEPDDSDGPDDEEGH
jgi:hypothetical protein